LVKGAAHAPIATWWFLGGPPELRRGGIGALIRTCVACRFLSGPTFRLRMHRAGSGWRAGRPWTATKLN